MMIALLLIMIALTTALAVISGFAWDEGYRAGKRRASIDGYGIDLRIFIPALTHHLDIQADGGDSAEDFVKFAVSQALKDVREYKLAPKPKGGA